MAITAPPEIKYGYVVGKIVRTIADDIDADFFPDTVPASGQVTFKPVKTTSNTTNYPAIVMHESVTGVIQETTGELYSTTGDLGVWLVVGTYDVVFNLNFGTLTGFQITVTEAHTETKPLDLALYRPTPSDPSTKFVVNEQIYINTLAEADRATAEAAKSKSEATKDKTEADRAASQVDTKLAALKASGELTGPVGPSNTLSIGTVSATTGNPSATISGTSPKQTLNLTLKTGATGAKGDKGDTGDQGPKGATGAKGDQGIQGVKGDTGDTGPANVLSMGTVSATTGNPSATITGATPNQTLNLTLKTGATGATGEQGIQGLKGDKGDKGDQGQGLNVVGSLPDPVNLPESGSPGDAYLISGDLWVWSDISSTYVNAGTIEGEQGPAGEQGIQGIQGPIGPEGPKGDKGDTGLEGPAGEDSALPLIDLNQSESNVVDLNNVVSPGVYPISSTSYLLNYPLSSGSVLVVYRFHPTSANWWIQEYTQYSMSRKFIRSTNDGGTTWTAWRELAGTEEATSTADGLMPKEDKALLDTNTISATASALVKRDSNAQINVPSTPTSDNHAASKKYVDGLTPTIPLATSAVDGLMPKADKAKLDGATASVTNSKIVTRTSTGQVSVPTTPVATQDSTSKAYVDAVKASSVQYKGTVENTQADSLTTAGDYILTAGSGATTLGYLQVRSNGSNIYQLLVVSYTVSVRNSTDGGTTWTDWKSFLTNTDVASSYMNGAMSKEDKIKLDGIEAGAKATVTSNDITDASSVGKILMTTASSTSARTTLGADVSRSTGAVSHLNTGTSTTSYVWTPKVLADYVKSRDAEIQEGVYRNFQKMRAPIDGTKWLVVGDSISTLTVSSFNGQSYTTLAPAMLGGKLQLKKRISVSGNRSDQQLAHLTTELASTTDYTMATVMVGTNDLSQSKSIASWQGYVGQIVDLLISKGIEPVLFTLPPRSGPSNPVGANVIQDQWNAWLKMFCYKNGIKYVDIWAAVADPTTREWKSGYVSSSDGVHPTPAGQYAMAAEVARTLGPFLKAAPSGSKYQLMAEADNTGGLLGAQVVTAPENPTGWTRTGGSNTTVVRDEIAPGGYAIDHVSTSSTQQTYINQFTGFSTGDKLRLVVKARVLDVSGVKPGDGLKILIRQWIGSAWSDQEENLIFGQQSVTNEYLDYVQEWKVPSSVTSFSVYAQVPATTSGNIHVRIGGMAIYDITKLGATE